MKCKVCHTMISNSKSECSICGFPYKENIRSSSESEKAAIVYRHQKLANVSIGVITYDYIIENEEVRLESEKQTVIANGNDLEYNRIVWCDKDYKNLPDGVVNVCVFVKKGAFNVRTYNMEVDTSTFKDHARIGVFIDEGLTARFIVGTPDKRIMTDRVSLI